MYLVAPWVVPLVERQEGDPPRPGEVLEDRVGVAEIVVPEALVGTKRDGPLELGDGSDAIEAVVTPEPGVAGLAEEMPQHPLLSLQRKEVSARVFAEASVQVEARVDQGPHRSGTGQEVGG